MGIRMLGNRQDAIAFGLAGLDVVECRTGQEAVAAIDAAHDDPLVALVIVSPAVAALGGDAIVRRRESGGLPIMVLLPDDGGDDVRGRTHAA